jgi:hypothetical protein
MGDQMDSKCRRLKLKVVTSAAEPQTEVALFAPRIADIVPVKATDSFESLPSERHIAALGCVDLRAGLS